METQNQQRKRNVAFKLTIGEISQGNPVYGDDRLLHVRVGDKEVVRVNILANCIDKYSSENQEKQYGTVTVDDASGQLKLKVFGEDVVMIEEILQGDTLQIIGTVRIWNDELYLQPEVMKKVDPRWLLVRKLEIQKMRKDAPIASQDSSGGGNSSGSGSQNGAIKDEVMQKIKDAEVDGGVDIDALIMGSTANPDIINEEIKKLLEEGLIYEPRPGRIRYLG